MGWARRNLFVPRLQVNQWGAFNAQLADRCRAQWPKRLRGHELTVGERLDEERAKLLPIAAPDMPQQARPQTVSSLCLARFDTNDYSVPCAYIGVLRLLESHSLAQLTNAVRRALQLGVEDYEAIKSLLLLPEEKTPAPLDLSGRAHLGAYRVARPDLSVCATLAGGVQ